MAVNFSIGNEPSDSVSVRHQSSRGLSSLVFDLVRPYYKWLLIIFLAMLVETVMSLSAPWPLKIIIDNVIGQRPLPAWLLWINQLSIGNDKIALALTAAASIVFIAAIGAVAGYIDNYFTESVAQNVANDLRRRLYHHLQKLSLSFYDRQQIGKVLSTLTTDVATIQDFTSSTLLSIIIDSLSILGMLILMFYLNWDFAMVAVGVAPFLLLFVARFKRTVKKATRELRLHQSKMPSSNKDWNPYEQSMLLEDRILKKKD
jgi:ABC-type multidrug transport system fused ATPase/permease subunit